MVCSLLPTLQKQIRAPNLSEGSTPILLGPWEIFQVKIFAPGDGAISEGEFLKGCLEDADLVRCCYFILILFSDLLGFVVWSWSLITHKSWLSFIILGEKPQERTRNRKWLIRIWFLYSIQYKYIFLRLLVLCLENWETYLYAWTLLGEIENLRLNEIPDIWNGLFLNIQPLLRILDGLEHTYKCFNLASKPLAVGGIWNLSLFKRVLWRPRMGRSHHVCMTTNVRECFFQHYFYMHRRWL